MQRIVKILTVLVLTSLNTSFAHGTKMCSTPSGQQGICKSILECPFLRSLATKEHISRKEVYYLRRLACGFENDIPKVCCPDYNPRSCTPTAKPPEPWTGCCGRPASDHYKMGTLITAIDQYPWMALVEHDAHNKTTMHCSAVLISSKYLISNAASLLNYRIGVPTRVRLGDFNINNDGPDCVTKTNGTSDCTDGAITIPIKRFIMHTERDMLKRRNDISLIQLTEMVSYTDFIRPICLPSMDITVNPPSYFRLYVAGWGATSTASRSDVLLHVELPYVALDICQKLYAMAQAYKTPRRRITLTNGHVCAGKAGSYACQGDSGGPLMYNTGLFTEVIGIVSFGWRRCGLPNIPGVYTKVFQYEAWIRENIARLDLITNT